MHLAGLASAVAGISIDKGVEFRDRHPGRHPHLRLHCCDFFGQAVPTRQLFISEGVNVLIFYEANTCATKRNGQFMLSRSQML